VEPAAEAPAAGVEAPTAPPSPAPTGRPLTLKEKLAAARAGGAAVPAAAKPAAAPPPPPAEPAAEAPAAGVEAPAVPPSPAPTGRPLTLKEKLAAARSGAAGAAPAAAKPAATRPAASVAPAAKAAPRVLPPLEKMTDPKDLAEALRQTAAKKEKATATAEAKPAAEAKPTAEAKPAKKEAKPQTVLPKPARPPAEAEAVARTDRRGFLIGSLFVSWVAVAWTAFTVGCVAFTQMMIRFMFPNVLAEPPSTIKVGLPSNFEPEEVSERFKAEWGFWIVRSTRYNGHDILYALQSVCTHLGCPPNWLAGEQKFKCPCHGSGFYISGVNFEGPAPRPLERFKVTLADDGQIIVDKSQKFQQELGQWADPDSFISA
ncbi:MAG: ubiquinol-cytochrome c reductase iron-sulfur subunit, partial [Planctomycetaceae bacterium]|nr:ubiquinol-cytochrome c reductase iron-sulfur subunit [Planctomycetaceae bacterium]